MVVFTECNQDTVLYLSRVTDILSRKSLEIQSHLLKHNDNSNGKDITPKILLIPIIYYTGSSSIFRICHHSMVCGKNNSWFVRI